MRKNRGRATNTHELTPPWWTVYKLSHCDVITIRGVFVMGSRYTHEQRKEIIKLHTQEGYSTSK